MYRKWYPPVRYVFYPLYRFMRRGLRLPSAVAYLIVWIVSGALHGALLLVFGQPVATGAFILLFTGFGLAGVGATWMKNREKRLRVAPPLGCCAHKPTAEPSAAPNGGPATRPGISGATDGPPSVS
jgi:hypothetical protein